MCTVKQIPKKKLKGVSSVCKNIQHCLACECCPFSDNPVCAVLYLCACPCVSPVVSVCALVSPFNALRCAFSMRFLRTQRPQHFVQAVTAFFHRRKMASLSVYHHSRGYVSSPTTVPNNPYPLSNCCISRHFSSYSQEFRHLSTLEL